MRKYLLNRIIRSILSVFMVVGIVFILVYSLVPRQNIFKEDPLFNKFTGDTKFDYMYKNLDRFGYIDYVTLNKYCKVLFPDTESTEYFACNKTPKDDVKTESIIAFENYYKAKGYKVDYFSNNKPYATKDNSPFVMMINWFKNLIKIDYSGFVQANPERFENVDPNMKKGFYFGTDWNGIPAILCSGCENKYMLYFNTSFPFIHTNYIKFNLGNSFPTYANTPIVDVISSNQGGYVYKQVVYPQGETKSSPILEHTCKYKGILDALDKTQFTDNYADCQSAKSDPSMIGTSFLIGIIALLLAYFVGIPLGMLMAKYKKGIIDNIGIAYIVFIISVPSLAYIFMFSRIGISLGFPQKFPLLGASNPASYVLPIISLSLPSIGGLMMWIRRYMIDQTSSDYVKFARSKGLSESEIYIKHILRNAIIPIVHGIPMGIVGTLVGAIITESVYSVPGMGKMLTASINTFNNPMIIALTFIFTSLSIFALIVGDFLMTMVDPRISFVGSGDRK